MSITTRCKCGGVFEFPDSAAGQAFLCGNCNANLVVPKPAMPLPPNMPPPRPAAPPPVASRVTKPQPARSRGCLPTIITILIVSTLCVLLVAGGFFWVRGKIRQAANQISGWTGLIKGLDELGNVDQIVKDYEARGYERVTGQVVVEADAITNKRIYLCQMLEVNSDIQADVAIIAQAATIHGTVHGDLDFMGQGLIIERDAVIKGNVNSRLAQLISVKGTIEGKLTGGYQALDAAPSRIKGGTTGAQEAIADIRSALDDAKNAAEKMRHLGDRRQARFESLDPFVQSIARPLASRGSRSEHEDALRQLANVAPNDQDRDTVVELIVPFLKQQRTANTAGEAFLVWGTVDHAPLLLEAIHADRHDLDDPNVILELLIEIDARDAVVTLINHPDRGVAATSLKMAAQWEITTPTLALQCARDLQQVDRRDPQAPQRIMRLLGTLEIEDAETKRQISQMLIPLLPLSLSSANAEVIQLLEKTTTEADIELLLEHARQKPGGETTNLLAKFPDPRVYEHLVALAVHGDFYATRIVRDHLKQDAETHLWPHLNNSSSTIRRNALQLVGQIGSAESLPRLEALTSNGAARHDATRAIRAITARGETSHQEAAATPNKPADNAAPPRFAINAADFPFRFTGADHVDRENQQQFVDHFVSQGYRSADGRAPPAEILEKTVLHHQVVRLRSNADCDLAAVGQSVRIYGTIAGDLDFMGQTLRIEADAVIKGNVRIHCAQAVYVYGRVEGQMAGTYLAVGGKERVAGGVSPSR